MDKINIAYTPNNENYEMTLVSIYSVIKNHQQNDLSFYIVVGKDFKNEYKTELNKINKFENCAIFIIEIDQQKYRTLTSRLLYSPRLSFFEFGKIINQNKILYLNSYSIVN